MFGRQDMEDVPACQQCFAQVLTLYRKPTEGLQEDGAEGPFLLAVGAHPGYEDGSQR